MYKTGVIYRLANGLTCKFLGYASPSSSCKGYSFMVLTPGKSKLKPGQTFTPTKVQTLTECGLIPGERLIELQQNYAKVAQLLAQMEDLDLALSEDGVLANADQKTSDLVMVLDTALPGAIEATEKLLSHLTHEASKLIR